MCIVTFDGQSTRERHENSCKLAAAALHSGAKRRSDNSVAPRLLFEAGCIGFAPTFQQKLHIPASWRPSTALTVRATSGSAFC
jgi:hypothetical protein